MGDSSLYYLLYTAKGREDILKEIKILLIEDDPDHAELIMEVLVEGDIKKEVVLVRDGQDAIDYFQESIIKWDGEVQLKIKLVILDLNLPKVDGMDVLKFLKKDSRYRLVPVIILSTSSDNKTISEAYENGADGYVVKPISYEEFVKNLEIIKEYCNGTRPQHPITYLRRL
ncbi:MAG: response regulator receiver protein [Candidatus Scalindua rubra]|uniref:Response regulator receiver protein n=1 Tax=Candidatus Scalindua rubra TaxID=1872076 RepID=A0A1E3XEY2_9BACT|nr:MAG: response regulator receiver protein [Candidatus Scalindua rubra]